MRRSTAMVIGACAALAVVYVKAVRPRTMRWGATDEEVERHLPGDHLVAKADYRATRAITIRARPEHVWPWLVQIGSGRAGWYSYDRIDNGGVPSAPTIVPELQHLVVGDIVPMGVGGEAGLIVKELEPCRRMLWWDGEGGYSWEWLLEPIGEWDTRLITRLRVTYPPLLSRRMLYALLASTGDIVMIRRELRGIRWRAERLASSAAMRQPGRIEEVAM